MVKINHIYRYCSPFFIVNFIRVNLLKLWVANSRFISNDKFFLKIYYLLAMKEFLDFKHPKTYSQKLQVLKLRNCEPIHSVLVDKFAVRSVVSNLIGESYLIPIIGVYNTFEEIDLVRLPKQFVLKTTHDSGSVIVCTNKDCFDWSLAREAMSKSLKSNYFFKSREYPYKHAVPRIMVEKYMHDNNQLVLDDYKFFCFNGDVEFVEVTKGKGNQKYRGYFSNNFTPLAITDNYNTKSGVFSKPDGFQEMIQIAQTLSKGFIHVRIDLYFISGKIYFGEYTFHHCGGIIKFNPDVYNYKFGDFVTL